MLIEFDLITIANLSRNYNLLDEIDYWASSNQIKYKTKRKNNILRLTFDDERYYHWFALTWPHNWAKFRIVENRTN